MKLKILHILNTIKVLPKGKHSLISLYSPIMKKVIVINEGKTLDIISSFLELWDKNNQCIIVVQKRVGELKNCLYFVETFSPLTCYCSLLTAHMLASLVVPQA